MIESTFLKAMPTSSNEATDIVVVGSGIGLFTSRLPHVPETPSMGKTPSPSEMRGTAETATTPWKLGDPIIEARSLVVLPDGRTLLVAMPPGEQPTNAQTVICHQG
jgi:hypothetical protein